MILVMGATGQVGSKITQRLLSEGHQVRCIARKFPNKELFKGAELCIGDANEVAFLSDSMRGCSAVFTLIPPNPTSEEARFYQNKFGEVVAEAIEEAGVKKVVNLSSVGANLESGTGPILGLHDQEERLNAITSADIIHLRCGYFMENYLKDIPSLISMNKIFSNVAADVPIPMIATRDIADRAAFLLANPEFDGKEVEYLLGQRDLSHNEAVKILGEALGKDVEYVEVSPKEAKTAMIGAGISENWADEYVEMGEALSRGIITKTLSRDATNTTKTSFESFVRDTFVEAYNKALADENSRKARSSSRHETRPN